MCTEVTSQFLYPDDNLLLAPFSNKSMQSFLRRKFWLTQNKCQILLPNLVNHTKTQSFSCIFVLNATKFSKIDRFKTFMSNDVHKAVLSVREHLNSYQMDTFVQKPQYHSNLLDQSIQMVTVRSNDPLLTA